EQTEQALLNLGAILEAAGSSLDRLVKTTIFYADVEDFATINEVYGRHMPDPPPARSAPANVQLPRGILISIDAVAVVNGQRKPSPSAGCGRWLIANPTVERGRERPFQRSRIDLPPPRER